MTIETFRLPPPSRYGCSSCGATVERIVAVPVAHRQHALDSSWFFLCAACALGAAALIVPEALAAGVVPK